MNFARFNSNLLFCTAPDQGCVCVSNVIIILLTELINGMFFSSPQLLGVREASGSTLFS